MTPFLKWPGGKRWFATNFRHLFPDSFDRYIEPFLGSGSVFFALQPRVAILGDANKDVINVYKALRSRHLAVEKLLKMHASMHSDEYYYQVREEKPRSMTERAARMLYLNRTCFNGIYRVNQLGEFNVPKGTKDRVILDSDNFPATARLLRRAEIVASDFQVLVDEANLGDLLFADPPYTVRHNSNGFIKYNEKLFSWQDQERLANSLARANNRGAFIVVTNANHSSLRELYSDLGFSCLTVSRFSSISGKSADRRQFEELVVTNSKKI